MRFTGMYGKAKETAFVLFEDQFSLKIGIVFQGKEKKLYFRDGGVSLFLISDQKDFSNQIQSWCWGSFSVPSACNVHCLAAV